MNDTPSAPPSKRKWLIGSAIGLVAAAAIVVMFVLPAEYGIDPTGVGRATGLIEIADPKMTPELKRGAARTGVLTIVDGALERLPGQTDHWEFELGPYESIEFKYTLPEGGRMNFEWNASAPLHYDMHAHPFEGGTALTESYSIAEAPGMKGQYVAAFTGIHGWYWQNRTLERVKLTLDASGAFTESTIFDSAGEQKRPLTPAK